MSIAFSVIKVTTLHFTLHVDSTGFRASKLVNDAGEVNRIESFHFFFGGGRPQESIPNSNASAL